MRKALTWMMCCLALMLGWGVIVLASASSIRSTQDHGTPLYYVKMQLIWIFGAVVIGFITARFDYQKWKKNFWLVPFCLGILALLVLVVMPGIRRSINGSYRWLNLGPVNIQPSECAKMLIAVSFAVYLDKIGIRVRQFWLGFVFPCMALGLVAVLLFLEPDFGSLVVVGFTGIILMFIAGTRLLFLIPGAILGGVGTLTALWFDPNRGPRIRAWLSGLTGGATPEAVAAAEAGKSYQQIQSLVAIKNGGPFGVGFNESIQKWNYLPEAHTDFIFAIGGEEFGFVFSLFVIVSFVIVMFCGLSIALRTQDRHARLLAFAMTFLLAFQSIFNLGVVTKLLPPKGLALPFFSYGGTNLFVAAFAIGTLINIARQVESDERFVRSRAIKNAVTTL